MNDDTMTPARKFAEQFMQYQPREFDTPAVAAIDAFKAGYAAAEDAAEQSRLKAEAEGGLGTDWKQLCLRAQEDQKTLLAERERLRAELAAVQSRVHDAYLRDPGEKNTAIEIGDDLVDRLNGIYTIPVNDGAGPLNGKNTFTRRFPTLPLNVEAAAEILRLRAELLKWRPLTEEEAEEAFEKAEAAPLSDERIAEIVHRAVDPAARISNDEQMWLAVRVQQLESELVDRADWQKVEAERTALLDATRDDAKKAIREALGGALWNRFWGPELERLGSVVCDVWIERERMRRRAEEMQRRAACVPLEFMPGWHVQNCSCFICLLLGDVCGAIRDLTPATTETKEN